MVEHVNLKQTAINVTVTFVEGFLAAWLITNHSTEKQALIGASAAGLSAVWNLVIKPLLKKQGVIR